MGITLFARGKINRIENIPLLIEEIRQFAVERNWPYHVIDEDFEASAAAVLTHRSSDEPGCIIEGTLGVKGIILNARQGVEMLAILFDRSGTLTDMMRQVSWIQSEGQGERFTMCKTQFGSIDEHVRIIELFDFLKKKYISNLTVDDEGAYWDSRDRRILAEKRVALGHAIRHAERVLSSIDLSENDSRDPEAIASRIEEALLNAEKEDGLNSR